MKRDEIIDLLEDCDLFKELNRAEIEKLSDLCSVKSYRKGESIFLQGDRNKDLMIIATGSVFLERSINLGVRKGNATIAILGRGRALGCWSTLLDQTHTLMASAVCQQPLKILVFDGSKLRDIMVENYEFGFRILQGLCFLLRDRIQSAYGALENI